MKKKKRIKKNKRWLTCGFLTARFFGSTLIGPKSGSFTSSLRIFSFNSSLLSPSSFRNVSMSSPKISIFFKYFVRAPRNRLRMKPNCLIPLYLILTFKVCVVLSRAPFLYFATHCNRLSIRGHIETKSQCANFKKKKKIIVCRILPASICWLPYEYRATNSSH